MARPTKLTPEIAAGIVTLIQHAVDPVVAAGAFGVRRSTFYEWIARGEGTDERRPVEAVYVEFAEAVAKAEEQAESALVSLAVTKVRTTADAIAILERRFRDRWRRSDEVRINVRALAERLAADDLDADEIMREAERILAMAE
ncbi:MAG TPA: hypothetical protein VFW92_06845 [Candidatus Limnocylindrales bacterium]|nr:hypothetical protein [Candidatus Limnocylindrales bacterium]